MIRCLILHRQSDAYHGPHSLTLDPKERELRAHIGHESWRVVEVLREPDGRGW